MPVVIHVCFLANLPDAYDCFILYVRHMSVFNKCAIFKLHFVKPGLETLFKQTTDIKQNHSSALFEQMYTYILM